MYSTYHETEFGNYVTQLKVTEHDIIVTPQLVPVAEEKNRFDSRWRKSVQASVHIMLTEEARTLFVEALGAELLDTGVYRRDGRDIRWGPDDKRGAWYTVDAFTTATFRQKVSYRGIAKPRQYERWAEAAQTVNAQAQAYLDGPAAPRVQALQEQLDALRGAFNFDVQTQILRVWSNPANFAFDPMPEDELVKAAEKALAAARESLQVARRAQHIARVAELREHLDRTDDPVLQKLREKLRENLAGAKPAADMFVN